MNKLDTASLLDDFESEARTHIENIESAFLNADALAVDSALVDNVFRAAHSLKGTAGFFSLDKMVSVAHELENIFARIRNKELTAGGEITEAVLKSVDCLKDLTDNLLSPEAVDIGAVLESLRSCSAPGSRTGKPPADTDPPFDPSLMENTVTRGHWGYFIKIDFNRKAGKYTGDPGGLLDEILSVGAITGAVVDGTRFNADDIPEKIFTALAGREAPSLQLLVTSALEPELFLIAVELPPGFIDIIPRETAGKTEAREADPVRIPPPAAKTDRSVRLDVSVVNKLTDLANEMVLTRNRLLSSASAYRGSVAGLAPALLELNRLSGEIQERVMRIRLQPIDTIFKKFPRIIHDMTRLLNKDIGIKTTGGDIALDKYLLDALSDPVTQLVKNSADHGIESAERRAALGKPPSGLITLSAQINDGLAIIAVTDDGAGIDTDALKRRCAERGMATEERLASISDELLYAFLFEPGFSTAQNVTSLSGRGVGMDIVKTNMEKLGGVIEVESVRGTGATVRLKIPLTLSLARTLIIEIDSIRYAVPEANVERILRIGGGTRGRRFEQINGSLVLNLDGWIVPAVTMSGIDAAARGAGLPEAGPVREKSTERRGVKGLLLKTGDRYFALPIDDAVKTEETLVNPLPVYLRQCRCYSNVALLGSGETVMVLSAEGIMRMTGIGGAEKETPAADDTESGMRQVITFKCSGPEYFALDADDVAGIERIPRENIQEIGGGFFVNVSKRSVRVLRPEDYAPVRKHGYNEKLLYLVMLKPKSRSEGSDVPAALLSVRVPDKIEGAFSLEHSLFKNEYIEGTEAYREKILIFLNIDGILRSGGK